jgi:membrane protease YdiL (CAAX protease family)
VTNWSAFAGLTGVVLVLLLALARLSQGAVKESTGKVSKSESTRTESAHDFNGKSRSPWSDDQHEIDTDVTRSRQSSDIAVEAETDTEIEIHKNAGSNTDENGRETIASSTSASIAQSQFSTGLLLANVALSQGLFAVIIAASAWYTAVPPASLGIDFGNPLSVGLPALATGIVVGLVLYAFNAAGGVCANALGYDYEERLRDLLTPQSSVGWVLLLCGILPIIAVFEELLFRAALIGALSTGFNISPWFLAGGSSAAFAFGHGAQGRLGILVTGVLGFVLAVVFIRTNSLLAVVVAHYLVNALEFTISGALGIEWT